MKRRTKAPAVSAPVMALVKIVVNKTPADDVGYGEAVNMVREMADQFDAAGAKPDDFDNICIQVRWMKWEGFCESTGDRGSHQGLAPHRSQEGRSRVQGDDLPEGFRDVNPAGV